ncbi:50S ribosomal protein L13 [Halobium palmae]|uniref:Large ribosomal subunit protein uL13 n=1 Tax=Halobium palmae TaxID=1776492 RepID=A0ABD5S2M7_9EURY
MSANAAEFDADVVVDARDCIMGRVASEVAQRALAGETVAVVNAERAVITGTEEDIMSVYRKRRDIGSDSGPYYPKRPDGIFKRAIRGMVPYKTDPGREAFENVRVYVGDPYEGSDGEAEVLEETSIDRLSTIKFVSLGEISENLGANVTW